MKKKMNQSTMTLIMNSVSILALIFMLFFLYYSNNVNSKINTASEERFSLAYNANRFMNGSAYLTNEVRAYAATGLETHYNNYWNEINNLKNRDIGAAAMEEIGITEEEQSLIDEMSHLSNMLVPLEEAAMENVKAGRTELAIQYVYGQEYSRSIEKINSIKSTFLEELDTRAYQEVTRLLGINKLLNIGMVISLAVICLMQILNFTLVKKKILRPIISIRDQMGEISLGNLSQDFVLEPDSSEIGMLVDSIHITKTELKKYISDIHDKLSQIGKGNMDISIDISYRGEFLPIQNAMRQIVGSLNIALNNINEASGLVSIGADQVALSSEAFATSTLEQSSAIEQILENVNELSNQVIHTADDANTACSCSTDATYQVQISNDKMHALSLAMADISSASNQIQTIISTIEDIAFQTNILALNAAIEAARAGAAGEGFAVVAEEVRNLAAKSSEAAKNTSALIKESLRLVQHGTELATDTTHALLSLVSGAKQSTELIEKIAASSAQQAQSIRELRDGVNHISNIVQTNAASAGESSSAAQELNVQAESLKASVHHFKIRSNKI